VERSGARDADEPDANATRTSRPAEHVQLDRGLIALLAAITATGSVALNIYAPALPLIQSEFGVSLAGAQATFSTALLAFAFGILIFGPLSDRFGRRSVVLGGLALFLFGTGVCLFADSIEVLTAGRVVQSFGSAAGMVVGRAMVGDLYPRDQMARAIAYLTMILVIGPTMAPALGGWLAETWNWRAIFVFLILAGTAALILAFLRLPETRPAGTHASSARAIALVSFELLRHRDFFVYLLTGAVIFASFIVFVSLVPYVMVEALGRGPTEYGIYYLFLTVGYFLGNWSVTRLWNRGVDRAIARGIALMTIATFVALALVGAGWRHPLAIFVPMSVLGFGQGMALPNLVASAVALAPDHAGVASSLLGFTQQFVGALCVQAMTVFATTTPYPVLVFCAGAGCLASIALVVQRAWRRGDREVVPTG
jgi:DHA1 family bicyclomycin/chloramphenicol resistance-like MFS transporter